MVYLITRNRHPSLSSPSVFLRLKHSYFYSYYNLQTSIVFLLLLSKQVTESLNPTHLKIRNDSHLHSHHKAMVGSTSKETHF